MATLGGLELLYHLCVRGDRKFDGLCPITSPGKASSFSPKRPSPKLFCRRQRLCSFRSRRARTLRASLTDAAAVSGTSEAVDVLKKTFKLKRTERVEGKISIRIDREKKHQNWLLTVGCSLPGKWILHWGVSYVGDASSEWDQPPTEMRPSGSIAIKDYAIETPLKKSPAATEQKPLYEVKISFSPRSSVAAIHFVLKDEETGAWYQHKGRDFKVPLSEYLQEDSNIVEPQKGFGVWSGALGSLVNMVYKAEGSESKNKEITTESKDSFEPKRQLEGIYEEQSVVKEVSVENSVGISVQKCPEKAKNLLYIETDAVGDVVLHWGVCRDNGKKWEIPPAPYPPRTTEFKKKALQTLLQRKEDGSGSRGMFTLNEEFVGFLFVLKLRESTWLNHMGNDFYIPLSNSISSETQLRQDQSEDHGNKGSSEEIISVPIQISGEAMRSNDTVHHNTFTDGIIGEIRNLMSDISSEKIQKTKTEAEQVSILQEIEKLAAEAYSIFRSVTPTATEVDVMESQLPKPPALVCSGTGSGFEILCQGFNWESHKSGKWFMELNEKAVQLSSLGFTIIWLPPPTESVSPEGYMPRDLYNLNSRYGSMDELKATVKCFHENGIKVLGDVVLNHRCAHYQNQNGVWNIFGGRLNWDDRAVVADDPHFQGRGNKSSGDNFHAAPNIDHSQDFVRKDIKEWLCWLREEIGYDGWRLDFVRGFWGGYVKDYLDASKPFFAVGEYWDSLNYTYGEMDHNQDAHRQRIIDWINATNGFAGAFDVTTKGILHSALQRCEYWRLSDQKGKPPGVVGWWPSRAVTFIENHDTGSTQGHWRFPRDKEMQGYAYILTHPGTPALFFDHIFSHYQPELATLISVRKRNELHCRSVVEIEKAERDVYGAIIDEKVAMKIGPGQYEPPGGSQRWSLAIEGRDYKVWEVSHE